MMSGTCHNHASERLSSTASPLLFETQLPSVDDEKNLPPTKLCMGPHRMVPIRASGAIVGKGYLASSHPRTGQARDDGRL
jgi:hypothetical protein